MGIAHKAIRSTGWKTDMVIGFPDGLLLLLFTTQALYAKAISVQQFYTLHLFIIGISTLFMTITVFLANRGDHHDEGTMSPQERQKLQRLEISGDTIEHIAVEMQEDQQKWEQTLAQENVQMTSYRRLPALRSALITGLFFFLGSLVPFLPFLLQEDFNAAANASIYISIFTLLLFAFLKSRVTNQKPWRSFFRYLAMGGLVLLAAYLIRLVI